jgi:hypothetical protein
MIMSNTTFASQAAPLRARPETSVLQPTAGILARSWQAYASWQSRLADGYVKDIQARLPLQTLKDLGYSDTEIAALRKRPGGVASYWA